MNIHPKQIIIPAVLAASAALILTSLVVNKGYASSKPIPNEHAKEIIPINLQQLSHKFPEGIQRWKGLIEEYAETYGVDPNLIGALILQESGGNPDVISSSGAVGLMQIMPRDGLAADFMCINGPCFKNRPSISELYDPEFNINYGTRMLSGLYTKMDNMRDALKTYGPINIGYYYADTVLSLKDYYD